MPQLVRASRPNQALASVQREFSFGQWEIDDHRKSVREIEETFQCERIERVHKK
jgi:hypothetical protein